MRELGEFLVEDAVEADGAAGVAFGTVGLEVPAERGDQLHLLLGGLRHLVLLLLASPADRVLAGLLHAQHVLPQRFLLRDWSVLLGRGEELPAAGVAEVFKHRDLLLLFRKEGDGLEVDIHGLDAVVLALGGPHLLDQAFPLRKLVRIRGGLL